MAVKLFGEIARAQASSRHPVGHILRRLIDISQIAVQLRVTFAETSEGGGSMFNGWTFQYHKGLTGTPQGDGVKNSEELVIKKKKKKKKKYKILISTS